MYTGFVPEKPVQIPEGITVGDRGNIKLVSEYGEPIYFYTHWAAYRLPEIVAQGLDKGRDRWGDEDYLNRIIFQTLLEGDESNLSYGISTREAGDAWRLVEVDHAKEEVSIYERVYSEDFADSHWRPVYEPKSFHEFVLDFLPVEVAV